MGKCHQISLTRALPRPDIIVSLKGVEKQLTNINPHKASGPDDIPVRVLNEPAVVVAPILTKLYRKSLETGQVPNDWKRAHITPVFKKGDHSRAAN